MRLKNRLADPIRRFFGQRHFARSTAVLAGGTAVAQAVGVALLPILTRLYSPQDFEALAVYAALLSLLSVVACLRYEIAIPVADGDADAAALVVLSVGLSFVIGLVLAGICLLFGDDLSQVLRVPGFSSFIWLVPVGVALAGCYMAFQHWALRQRDFVAIARTRMTQAIAGGGMQVAAGLLGAAPLGLLLGQMINSGAGVVGLAKRFLWTVGRSPFRSRVALAGVARRHKQFPKYSVPEAFANAGSSQIPIILIASLSVGPEAGFLLLALRVLSAPMSLIGKSIGQVYFSEAASKTSPKELARLTAGVVRGGLRIGVGPLVFVGFVAPVAFGNLFGEQWAEAGHTVVWLVPWFALQLLAAPIAMIMHVVGQQRRLMILTFTGLILRVSAVLAAAKLNNHFVVEAYAIASTIFYGFCLAAFVRASTAKYQEMLWILLRALPVLGLWAASGVVFVVVAEGVSL